MESDCPHSAAFDTVDIVMILYSLEFGLSDPALWRFASYLYHRTQSVCVNHSTVLNYVVLQCSLLGQLLFALYIRLHSLHYLLIAVLITTFMVMTSVNSYRLTVPNLILICNYFVSFLVISSHGWLVSS